MFNRWKTYPKHIPKKRGWYICSIRYGESQDKHMLWIYFGMKRHKNGKIIDD